MHSITEDLIMLAVLVILTTGAVIDHYLEKKK